MSKQKTVWACRECGHNEPKWVGQCPCCEGWNTLDQDVVLKETRFETPRSAPVRLHEVSLDAAPRIQTGIDEFDRLLGRGIVKGSFSLVGGDPGIGKSTLLLQASQAVAAQGLTVLYICGEESVAQTSLRAKRLGVSSDNLYLLSETQYEAIQQAIDRVRPDMLVIDSIQIVYKNDIPSAPGSVTQVRENAASFMHLAKGREMATFLIGHVTKSGEIAGPRLLEHLVDTVLYFEGDKQHTYRLMRVIKNRFGPTDEIALFHMGAAGLTEVANPSQMFLEERLENRSGSVVIPTLEGSRPLLVEVQALVTNTVYATPSRRQAGLDQNRLALLLAVLEKRIGYPLHNRDVFVSVAAGMRILEPAVDLGVLLAIASSLTNRIIDGNTLVIGEVGLGGEIRSVPRIESRLKEAIHLGFTRAVVPKRNLKGLASVLKEHISLVGVAYVEEAIDATLN